MSAPSRLQSEQRQVRGLGILLTVCVITGYATWLAGVGSAGLQVTVLMHAVAGILLSPLLLLYLWNHFRRTLGQRRAGVLFSGLAAALLATAGVISGLYLTWYGQSETTRWILQSHIATLSGFLLLTALHAVLHIRGYDPKRRQRQSSAWPSLERLSWRRLALGVAAVPVICALAGLGFQAVSPEPDNAPAVADYSFPYGGHPFRPSQTETRDGAFLAVSEIAGSDDCASCHEAIADQWAQSVHRHAADDPTYVTNINLLAQNKGIAATRYCEGCHAPVALLTGQLSEGGQHGGVSGTLANREGVSCLSCHNIDRIENTEGVASYRIGPASKQLFAHTQQPALVALRHWVTRMNPDLHRAEMARPALSTPELCASCHAQFMDADLNHWGWVKMQDEYSAWRNSPFSGHNTEEFGQQPVQTCNDCHMSATLARDPSADSRGTVAGHFFPGANTVVPRHFGHDRQVERTRDFLRGNKVSVSIEEPNRSDAGQTLGALNEDLRSRTEAPYFYYLGETAELNVILNNRGVGHNFPGGTLDINEAWVSLTVTDAAGEVVYRSGAISGDSYAPLAVDPEAWFYRSRPVDRRGNLVWKHDLFNRIGETEKRVIPAGKSDLVTFSFPIPDWVKGPLTVTATLNYRKLNDRYARWALGEAYAPVPVVDMARDTLVIPVYIRDPVAEL